LNNNKYDLSNGNWSLDLNSSSPNDAYLNYLSYLTFNYDSNINDALNSSFRNIKNGL
jgi:hypothetical protein